MKRAAKRDNEEEAIVCALMVAGVRVQRLSDPGVPDLLTYTPRTGLQLLEVKSRYGTLTKAQKQFTMPYTVVRSVTEALSLFGIVDTKEPSCVRRTLPRRMGRSG